MPESGIPAAISNSPNPPPTFRLFDEVRRRLRLKHYRLRTEQAYPYWIRRYIQTNGRRHPRAIGGKEVEHFLSELARRYQVGPSTQNQALSELLFLYREVLSIDLPWMDNVARAKRAPQPDEFPAHTPKNPPACPTRVNFPG